MMLQLSLVYSNVHQHFLLSQTTHAIRNYSSDGFNSLI
jgi:hypothetical protein